MLTSIRLTLLVFSSQQDILWMKKPKVVAITISRVEADGKESHFLPHSPSAALPRCRFTALL